MPDHFGTLCIKGLMGKKDILLELKLLGRDNAINFIINNLFLLSEKRNIYNFTKGKNLYKYEVNLDAIFTSPKYDLENINSWH